MTVGPGDFVKVMYRGRDVPARDASGNFQVVSRDTEKPLTLMWDSRPYVCPVGKETFVPFEAMMLAFGDPRSTDNMRSVRDAAGNVMFVSDRATEVRRLRTLYDNQNGPEDQILFAPDAVISDVEGDTIQTVIDDPVGQAVYPVPTTALDREQLLAQLQRQQRMIEALAEAQGVNLGDEDSDEESPKPADPFAQPPEDK